MNSRRTKAMLRAAVKGGLRVGAAAVGRFRPGRGRHDDIPRVLCYHGVCDVPPDEWSVTPAQLRRHMALVCRDYTPVSLDDVVSWHLGETTLPPRAVAVTFDDGFVDLVEHAAPILAEMGVPGTAFVASALISGGTPDGSYVPTRPIMSWAQVGQLADAGWTIGSHSLNHPQLASLDTDASRRQLVESRDELEQRLGADVGLLAYPYGTASTVSLRDQQLAAECGYRAAFMDTTGRLERASDTWALPRSKVLGTDQMFVVRASLRGDMDLWRLVESRR